MALRQTEQLSDATALLRRKVRTQPQIIQHVDGMRDSGIVAVDTIECEHHTGVGGQAGRNTSRWIASSKLHLWNLSGLATTDRT
jgi:hypothetical protein